MYSFKWPLSDIENMMPWEREVYVTLLVKQIEEEKERQRQKNG